MAKKKTAKVAKKAKRRRGKPIPSSAWIAGAKAFAALPVYAIRAVTPRYNVGDVVVTKVSIPYLDVIVPAGTEGIVRDTTDFSGTVYYFVRFRADTLNRLVRDNQLV